MSDEADKPAQERKRLAREVLDRFFIYSELDALVAPLNEVRAAAPPQLVPIIDAFKSNIRAA